MTASGSSAPKPLHEKDQLLVAPRQSSAPAEPLPAHIGKYSVLERIGVGAMGVVYKCAQPGLDRPVAVKVLAARPGGEQQIARFQREARAAARLAHPNVVQVFDVGDEGNLYFFVMEYIDGCSLDRLIGTPYLTLPRTLSLVCHVARALQAAHDQGIIHRDVKPSNILIHRSGQPKLADFGLAKPLDEAQSLSGSGDLVGTPRYMSPEQVLETTQEIDGRTDVYSLGAVLYELLTGRPPVSGANVLAILRKLTDEEPIPVRERNPAVPEAVAAICRRAMEKDRTRRYRTAGEFGDALQNYLLEQLLGRPEPAVSGEGPELMAALLPPARTAEANAGRLWQRQAIFASVALVILAGIGLVTHLAGNARRRDAAGDLVKQVGEQLLVPAGRGATAPRDHWNAVLENLNAVLKDNPDHGEARLLRARVCRRAGEYLAAGDDLDALLRKEPENRAAVQERMLAAYQLHVLYLGNIGEAALRPPGPACLREDADRLVEQGDPLQKYAARLVGALARGRASAAAQLIETERPFEAAAHGGPDLTMLEADAWFHAAEEALAVELAASDDRPAKQNQRERVVRRAIQALNRGLDADPNHVGLLFLHANSFRRRAAWQAADGGDLATLLKRHKGNFENALDRLRQATLRAGCDTAVARAVLLSNYGNEEAALEHVKDALSCRPIVPYLHTYRAWLALHAPAEEQLSSEEIHQILRDFQRAFDSPPEAANAYFVRSLLHAVAGQWDEAQLDLRQCRRLLGRDSLPTSVAAYNAWFAKASAPMMEFLDATQEVLPTLPVSVTVRIRLGEEVLKRLNDAAAGEENKLAAADVKKRKGWTHFRLAKAFAEKQDRNLTLQHVREGLQLQLPDLKPQTFRDDGAFSAWSEDMEFVKLYKKFEAP